MECILPVQPDIWKQPFRANEGSTGGNQTVPQVIGLRNGNILVVWEDDGANNGPSAGIDIMGQLFDPEGTAIGTPRQINSPSDFGETGPQIVALSDGGFAMAYGGFDATSGFVQVERYNANAQSIASHQIRNPSINNWEITADSAGNYTVVYERRSATADFDIYALTYNNQTNQPGPERNNVAYNGQQDDRLNGLASLANGQIITLGNEADDQGYQKNWFTVTDPATGALIAGPHPPYGLLSLQQGHAQDVAVLETGRFVSLWNQSENFVEFGLWMNLRGLDPTDFTFPVQIALGTNRGHVLALPGGDFFVIWQPSNETTLYGRRYRPDGTPAADADDIVANVAINGISESRPALTTDGRILITYKDTSLEVALVILDPRVGNVLGTNGDDALTARTSSTHMVGGAGNDRLYGRDGNDTMDGGENDDQLFGRGGNDTLAGALGIDRLEGGPGDDTYVLHDVNSQQVGTAPGGGPIIQIRFDEVIEAANGGVDTIQITRAGSFGFGTSYELPSHVENGIIQFGNPFSLFGNGLDNQLTGSSGADTLDGGEGNDFLSGGTGDDTLNGGNDSDLLFGGDGNDTLNGGAAGDFMDGGAGSDAIDGDDGFDLVSWLLETTGATVNLANAALNAGSAAGDTVTNVEGLYLTNSGDNYTGGVTGLFVYGFGGNDTITGSDQSDFIDGGAGADTINAGAGFDYVSYNSSATAVTLNLQTPANNAGDAAGDTISNADAYILTEFDDTFIGLTSGQNIVFGYGGNDTLTGGFNANNWLFGGSGNDRMVGGGIADLFVGDSGADTIVPVTRTPIAGSSVFGFTPGADALEISRSAFGLSAGYVVTNGSTFAAGTAPGNTMASPTFIYYTNSGLLYFDPDGTGATAATLLMQFDNAAALTQNDFHLV